MMPDTSEFDYIVVGAGSAGCVLARRLTEDGHTSVLVLEAGDWDRDPLIHIPIGIGKIFPERLHDWNYFAQPDDNLDGRAIECARGKVVGGSSSVNVMAYVRGHRGDYDRWAAAGLSDWSYERVLPYFRRSETWEGGENLYRGGAGPLKVQTTRYSDPILSAFIKAGHASGYPVTADYNGAEQEGFGFIQETIHKGRRMSAATAYLRPALKRSSLRVETGALVSKVFLAADRATGVLYRRAGQEVTASARCEVILSAGVINTPKILMLSGIGDPVKLQPHGIKPVVELPGVGLNLRDHLSVLATYRRRDTSTFHKAMRYDRLAWSIVKAYFAGRGFASDLPIGVTAFLKTQPELALPDVQFLFLAAAFPAHAYFSPWIRPVPDTFGCRVALLRPEGCGSITLASANPSDAPIIRQNHYSTPTDRATLRRGLALLRRIVAHPEMNAHVGNELAPGSDAINDETIDAFVRRTGVTVHHPAGTCRMGVASDTTAVVDPELRVKGLQGLRVVDASILPDLVGGNINAVVMMIAEKASDLLRGRPALEPLALAS
jgi:4-pyridoxate dehydrogenase